MPITTVAIPKSQPVFRNVTLIYLDSILATNTALGYLQGIRSGTLSEDSQTSIIYHVYEDQYATDLCKLVTIPAPDVIVRPPSSRCDSRCYFAKIRARYPAAADISHCFQKQQGFKVGQCKTLEAAVGSFTLSNLPEISNRDLLIVDDMMGDGLTAAALLTLLQGNGLTFSNVTLAVAAIA